MESLNCKIQNEEVSFPLGMHFSFFDEFGLQLQTLNYYGNFNHAKPT